MLSSKPTALALLLLLSFIWYILIISQNDYFFFHATKYYDTTQLKHDHHHRFPQWGDEGIDFDPLMRFVLRTLNDTATTVRSTKSHSRFPEILYIADSQGVWVSQTLAQKSTWKAISAHRRPPTEELFVAAWELLQQQSTHSTRWKRLSDGFPFLAWYGDPKSCNFHNWVEEEENNTNTAHSIPLFTTCAPVTCHYAFPIPSYQNRASAQANTTEWRRVQAEYQARYASSNNNKINQLVWRGSLSAPNEYFNSTRWRVVAQPQDERVNVGFVSIGHINADMNDVDIELKQVISPMPDFQRYAAILDIDGNSWSSRFGELLCYNSIVVKVEPEYVEYIYRDLFPWTHYIPMAANLSDWNEVLDFIFDPRNKETMERIIQNANDWCSHHLTLVSLATDMLDVWESYVSYLDKGNPAWEIEWAKYKTLIFNSTFDMVKII